MDEPDRLGEAGGPDTLVREDRPEVAALVDELRDDVRSLIGLPLEGVTPALDRAWP